MTGVFELENIFSNIIFFNVVGLEVTYCIVTLSHQRYICSTFSLSVDLISLPLIKEEKNYTINILNRTLLCVQEILPHFILTSWTDNNHVLLI